MVAWSKEVFAKNLKRYMEENGENQKELAEIVGVSAPTVNDWLKAKIYPRIDKIEILANHFGILKSDLIEDKPIIPATKMYSNMEIGSLIKAKRQEKGLSQDAFAKMLGFSAATVARWESGNVTKIRRATIQDMAKILGISPLNLIGFTIEHTEKEERQKRLKEEWDKMFSDADFTDEEFIEIANYAQYLLNKRQQNK